MAYSESELRDIIKDRCEQQGREAVAKELGVSEAYISMILSKTDPRPITANVAKQLGFQLETSVSKVFIPIKELA